jgi:hypothetical protein
MGKYSNYDPTENVIASDFTGLHITSNLMVEIAQEAKDIAATLPTKVYILVCWENVELDMDKDDYGQQVAELLKHVKGIIRYGATNLLTNVTIRQQTVKRHLQNTQSHLYKTKAEALAALHKLQQADSTDHSP